MGHMSYGDAGRFMPTVGLMRLREWLRSIGIQGGGGIRGRRPLRLECHTARDLDALGVYPAIIFG